MYTDLRIKTLVARYRELFDEWITYSLWRKKGDDGHPLKPFEESMPFDRPDEEGKLPKELHELYKVRPRGSPDPHPNSNPTPTPGPTPDPKLYKGLDSSLSYADVFERKCYLSLKPTPHPNPRGP